MVGLSGCGIGYLWHVTVGQATILLHQRPVEEVLLDTRLTPQEQHKLHLILEVRSFAITQLDLHESKSYTTFVQLDRPYVSYNLSAAAPDAFKPHKSGAFLSWAACRIRDSLIKTMPCASNMP
jgi:predicted aminopeptidase